MRWARRHGPAQRERHVPIEKAFAKIKHRLRNAAARSRDTLWRAVGEVLDDIEPQECANCL